MAVWGAWEQLRELDGRASALARGAGAMRLLLGEVLARIDSLSAHHSFGFSSLGAYVTERCQRGGTWTRDALRMARAVESFPELRAAVLQGLVTWSALGWALRGLHPYLAARAALADGMLAAAERLWLARARKCSVRELAEMVRRAEEGTQRPRGSPPRGRPTASDGARGEAPLGGFDGAARTSDGAEPLSPVALHPFLLRLPSHVLTLTVRSETAWWFECACGVYERSVGDCSWTARSAEGFMLALLAEARTALEGEAPLDDAAVERWGAYVRMLEEWREEAERRCDAQQTALPAVDGVGLAELDGEGLDRATAAELDERVRQLSLALGRRDLELGILADWLWRADAWRRLGFASEAHYVRERMGCSYSQWKARRALTRKLGERAIVRTAFLRGEIGLEAALLLLRVARDGESERSWVDRARERTFKHLREEVRAAELGEQQFGRAPFPPSEDAMRRVLAVEGRVKSGAVLLAGGCATDGDGGAVDGVLDGAIGGAVGGESRMSVTGRAWLDLRGELAEVFRGAFLAGPGEPDVRREPKTCPSSFRRKGQVRLRLRLERDTLVEFRALEKLFRRGRRGDFFEFLCRHFLEVWAPAMRTDVKYAHVYRRDAFTCSSPVCSRRDVQPHHLRFRSQGGGDEDENLTALCTWCHLEGVHGGRIRVAPPASAMCWRVGAVRPFEVRGRRKSGGERAQPAMAPRTLSTRREEVGGAIPSARR